MANTKIQLKRTSTTGRTPNTTSSGNSQYINTGELALNLTDRKLFSSDGTNPAFEIGSNLNSLSVATTINAASYTVGSSFIANTTGAYHTGLVNAASYTVGTGFIANTTVLNSNTNVNLTVNNKKLSFATVNASSNVYFIQQSDDNFVLYSTNTSYGARAIWGIVANSITSNFNISVRSSHNGGLTIPAGVTLLDSTGSQGTAGQALLSNGTSNVYWGAVTAGAAGSNSQVQFNNSGLAGASAGFTFNNTTNTLAVANALTVSLVSANLSAGYANVTGQVNTATFFAATSANVGGNVQITVSQFGVTGNSTTAPTMSLTGSALTIGNSTVTGAPSINLANSTGNTTVNVTSIGSSWGLIANASGVYHSGVVNAANFVTTGTVNTATVYATGQINAASYTTTNSVSNTSGFFPISNAAVGALGNSTSRWIITANSITANGLTISGGANVSSNLNVTGTANVSNNLNVIGQIQLGTYGTTNGILITNTGITVGNLTHSTTHTRSQFVIITDTVRANLTSTALTIGNSTVTAAPSINLANSTGNTTVNAIAIGSSWGLIANASGIYHSGVVNAASHTVGTTFTANATLVNAAAINVVNQTNTATIYAATSANVGGNVQITVSQYGITGNSTTAPTMSLTASALTIGNSTVTGAPSIKLANSTGNTTVNAIAIGSSWGLSSNSTGLYHSNSLTIGNTSGDFTSVNSSIVKIVGGGSGNLSIVAYDGTLGGPSIYMKPSETSGGTVISPGAIYMVPTAYTLASAKYGPLISAEGAYPGFAYFDPADGSERSFIGEDGIRYATAAGTTLFEVNGTNLFSYNTLLVGKTAADAGATSGVELLRSGTSYFTRSASTVMIINRLTSDSTLVSLQQDSVTEGSISVSGTTITYGTFAGAHWSQLSDNSRPNILRGTVVETIDEMCQWENEANDQLSKFKISDTVASKSVYGVFQTWDNDDDVNNDANIVSLGAYLIRVDAGVTVSKDDLLESAGNGCARVQSDDIIRSSTIGKVTNGSHVIETYEDGSYLVPCVLYCG